MNQSSDEQAECPLCMEPFEVDDLNFFPCTCGYQICRFCWHRIRTDENGLCPACRKAYPENPADFKPLSQEQMAKLKAEKRQKEQQRKQKATENRKHLANVRVVQKNLVFVVGLPIRLADQNVLKKHEYFGKFGKIHKVVINQSTSYAGAMGPSASAYVTYNRCEDALRAIQAVNNICVDNRILKTSLGTTKYCSHFIKTQTCPKPDCMYLHDLGDPEASFTKEEMQQGKHQEYEKKLHEQLNNSMSQDRKTTPSPPALGNSNPTSNCTSAFPSVNKEAWPSLQNGVTQSNTGSTPTVPVTSIPETTASTTTTNIIQTISTTSSTTSSSNVSGKQQNSSKFKNKEKNNPSCEKASNNKRKGKEKQMNSLNNSSRNNNNNNNNNNIHIADKHVSSGKSNKEKEKRTTTETTNQTENSSLNNSRILSANHRSSLFGSDSSSFFSSNNFSSVMRTGSKDLIPSPNGYMLVPDNACDSNYGKLVNHNDNNDRGEIESKSLTNNENEKLNPTEETEKPLTNGYLGDTVNSTFEPVNYTQKDGFSYQNGGLSYSNNSNSQQNVFNTYISINKFGSQLKNENLLIDNNDVFANPNNQLLNQQIFLKQQLAQQRNQQNLQQILLQQQQQQQQQQQSVYQQPQNQYSQDFRLVQQQQQQQQQQPQQPINGLHSQHFNYLQQSNIRDQLLLQQKPNQLILNNYSQTGNNFIQIPNGEDLVVDNLLPQQKYIENGLNHANLYSPEYKLKDNMKNDDDKDSADIHGRGADDELGFDPFHETQKALADLMEKELLIQQSKQVLQHKNEQFYRQSTQNYQNHHSYDSCPRGFNQLQMNMLNQQNHMLGGKLLAQLHSQQILNSTNQKATGNNRIDGIRCPLPPPGFTLSSQSTAAPHMNSFGQAVPRSSNSSKILPYVGLSNGESSYASHYVPNGITKSEDWPDSLRSLVHDGSISPPNTGSPSFTSAPKGWSNIGTCSDWTALDPAIVSSSRSQHLALHSQSLINNQGLSQLHESQLQNQMSQLSLGNVLTHNNWSTHRQNEDNWSAHIQNSAVPPPGFTLRHTGAEIKKTVTSGIESLE